MTPPKKYEIFFHLDRDQRGPERPTFHADRVLGRQVASRGLFWPHEPWEHTLQGVDPKP